MRTVFVLFDSLNRHLLGCYGGARIPTPNFDRLAQKTVVFDRHYAGSLPCMPARRDMLTGHLSFLHRSWGPLEPFDNAYPDLLREAGVYSHLITDHFHYWEDGGATYHTRYDSHEFLRGQEGDPWQGVVAPDFDRLEQRYHPRQFSRTQRSYQRHNVVNREFIRNEEEFPSIQCFTRGLEFLERNREADDWFLQLETFSPHEPFMAPARFKAPFATGWNGPVRDWPRYGKVDELPEEADELRANYYAVVAMCDWQLGRLLDFFDANDMWKDTTLVVSTDHGFLLGEHDFWAKNRMNMYEEIVHIPLFVHDPRHPELAGTRSAALTQSIDMAKTFLDAFGVAPAPEMQGHSLLSMLGGEQRREAAIFGYFGAAVNVTDGRHSYHLFPPDISTQEINQYTLMPTHIWQPFSVEELRAATLAPPFGFTKGVPLLKVPVTARTPMYNNYGPGALLESDTRLYDLAADPHQQHPYHDAAVEARLRGLMAQLMADNEAPPEAYARLGLSPAAPAEIGAGA
jgi:arylsulfatase A-like enzyme